MADLSEGVIARSLWIDYGSGQLACSNIYYYAFESDLLILRDSGTVIEYEIKLSVSDFKAGLKKRARLSASDKNRRIRQIFNDERNTVSRHDYLTSGMGANMFYYVAPKEVIDKVDIPDWAGIIRVSPNQSADVCSRVMIKKAKVLHRNKAPESMRNKILTSCYYKYWRNFAIKDVEAVNA